MKRAAESQLTKDTSENDEEPTEGGTGFQKADPSVLGSRKIRGLPKRSLAPTDVPNSQGQPTLKTGPSSEVAEQSPEPVSRFGAFAGFGAAAGGTSAFTFTVPSSQTSNTPSQPITSPSAVFSSSMSASPAPKTFLSYPGPSNPTPPNTPPSTTHDAQNKQDAALKYYMSLRGINSSFLDAATNAIRADPFMDIGELLEKYKTFRHVAQQDFDSCSKAGTSESIRPASTSQVHASNTPTNIRISSSRGASGPFASTMDGITKDSPFGTSASPFILPKSPGISMGDNSASGRFSFVSEKATSMSAKPESHPPLSDAGQAITKASKSTPVTSHPGFENEKQPTKTDAPSFSFNLAAPASPLTPGLSSFLSSSKQITRETSPTPVKMGSSASPPASSSFGFGSGKNLGVSSSFSSFNKGSIGNPVGFGFGGPSTVASGGLNPDATFESKSPAGADAVEDNTDSSSIIPFTAEHDPSPGPSQGSVYDGDGPGEEEESNLHESRAQVYKMISTSDKKGWTSLGTGNMKLKGHNELPKRRILMRKSNTGHVILNFNLLPPFQVTVDKKVIMFRVPGEDESGAVFRVRVQTETEALKWQEIINDELNRLVPPHDK